MKTTSLIIAVLLMFALPCAFADNMTLTSNTTISIQSSSEESSVHASQTADASADVCGDDCKRTAITTKNDVDTVSGQAPPANDPFEQDLGVVTTIERLKGIIAVEGDTVATTYDVRLENNKLFLLTEEGPREIPDSVNVVSAVTGEKVGMTKVQRASIALEESVPVYTVEGVSPRKLFGFVPVTVRIEAKIDAQTQAVKGVQRSWWAVLTTN